MIKEEVQAAKREIIEGNLFLILQFNFEEVFETRRI